MTEFFNALIAEQVDGKQVTSLKRITVSDLPDEPVLVDVEYSTLNYKDGLAVSGLGKICRTLPLICGIDLAGTVAESSDPSCQPGDRILVNGFGMSETFNGGYSQRQRIKPEWVVRVPDNMSLEECMAIGTAGYTAMLCVQSLQDAGVELERQIQPDSVGRVGHDWNHDVLAGQRKVDRPEWFAVSGICHPDESRKPPLRIRKKRAYPIVLLRQMPQQPHIGLGQVDATHAEALDVDPCPVHGRETAQVGHQGSGPSSAKLLAHSLDLAAEA